MSLRERRNVVYDSSSLLPHKREGSDMLNRNTDKVLNLIAALDDERRNYLNKYLENAPISILEQIEIVNMKGGTTFIYEGEEIEKIYILVDGSVIPPDSYSNLPHESSPCHKSAVSFFKRFLCSDEMYRRPPLHRRYPSAVNSRIALSTVRVESMTTYLMKMVFGEGGSISASNKISGFQRIEIPFIKDIPVIGEILSGYTPLVYLTFILVPVLAFLLYRTHMGISLRAVGEE